MIIFSQNAFKSCDNRGKTAGSKYLSLQLYSFTGICVMYEKMIYYIDPTDD